MRILLTGSTSFTGKYLLPLIQEAGWDVFLLVRQSHGFSNEIIWDFLGPLPSNMPACDAVVHLAADINFTKEIDIDLYRVNILATAKLVSYAHQCNAHFIFASSIAVHEASTHLGKESVISTNNHYGVSKYVAEEIIKEFLKKYSILRISGIYGLNGPQHLGLNKAITDALNNEIAPTLKGVGNAKRNYICVLDVAQWIFSLLKQHKEKKEIISNTYYLAHTEIMSIRQYLEKVVSELLPDKTVNMIDGPEGQDCIVDGSISPFKLTKFGDYLKSIKDKNYVNF